MTFFVVALSVAISLFGTHRLLSLASLSLLHLTLMNLAEERGGGGGEIKQGEERIRKQEEEEDSSGTAAEEKFALGRNRLQTWHAG